MKILRRDMTVAAAVIFAVILSVAMLCTGCGSKGRTQTYERSGDTAVPDNAAVTELDCADIYEYTQELEDITIKSREFRYANGDVFWHDKLRMSEENCAGCKYSI